MKTVFVLYSSKTSPSGRALANKMIANCPPGFSIHFGTTKVLSRFIRKNGNRYPDTIVNMGEFKAEVNTRSRPSGTPVVLNHPNSVGKSSNKRGSRLRFRDAGIPAPALWENSCSSIPMASYPVVGRTTHHTQAHGFWFCKDFHQARRATNEGATHFLKFIPDTREYRIHIIAASKKEERSKEDYVSIKLSEKIFSAATKKPGYDVIKNHSNGWTFVSAKEEPRKGLYNEMRLISKKAVSLFGLDWGAVDIMYDAKNDEIYVLEINTSPCLTDATSNTLEKYSEWVMHLCGMKTKDLSKLMEKKVNKAPPQAFKPNPKPKIPRKSDASVLRGFVKRMGL